MKFKTAVECKLFAINGLEGFWKKVPNKIGMNMPEAVRAKTEKSKLAAWFIPAEMQHYDEAKIKGYVCHMKPMIPNEEGWVCDVCGHQVYHEEFTSDDFPAE